MCTRVDDTPEEAQSMVNGELSDAFLFPTVSSEAVGPLLAGPALSAG
jgi:hypothetical protein